jgi:hypothetical protein
MDDASDLARRIELTKEGTAHSLQLRFAGPDDQRLKLEVRAMTRFQSGNWHDLRSCRLETDGLRTPDWDRLALQLPPTDAAAAPAPLELRAPPRRLRAVLLGLDRHETRHSPYVRGTRVAAEVACTRGATGALTPGVANHRATCWFWIPRL